MASALALASCTPPEIEVTAKRLNGRQVITLSQDWGLLFSDKKAPCVDRLDLIESGPNRQPVWRFEAPTSECVNLGSFTVGVVPSGFVERIALPPAARGRFEVQVIGTGLGQGEIILP